MKKMLLRMIFKILDKYFKSQNYVNAQNKYFKSHYAFDIETQLRIRALQSTCEFIEKNMSHLPMFKNKQDALDFSLKQVKISGLYCEFGVYKGASVNHIAKVTKQEVHAFDSFEGLPETWLTTHKEGHFALEKLPHFEPNVVVHKGWFNETLPDFTEKYKAPLAFLHIDCDLYSSTKTVFEALNKQIIKDTIILFDEYFNYPHWQQHEYKVFKEFTEANKISFEYLCYSSNTFGSKVAVRILDRE
ncbi:MAG: class I SAM-dependent methyltransferase [Bacteroidetes bacterium]|nr:class I SAM-dependent methyltransferase [Bacteroidota bacterium]MCC7514027.1 class I SAM-dependent methyltransferase [Bacteroidia bacterium]HCI58181.1 hypothetical protein [Bacteroidota bacterium]HMW08807.1 class I SAM-dependent methyltransferase [Bacteroidia bacterium]HMY13203.1 class I SAM-dependent methyltransferase [Bacteroidia bacterium]